VTASWIRPWFPRKSGRASARFKACYAAVCAHKRNPYLSGKIQGALDPCTAAGTVSGVDIADTAWVIQRYRGASNNSWHVGASQHQRAGSVEVEFPFVFTASSVGEAWVDSAPEPYIFHGLAACVSPRHTGVEQNQYLRGFECRGGQRFIWLSLLNRTSRFRRKSRSPWRAGAGQLRLLRRTGYPGPQRSTRWHRRWSGKAEEYRTKHGRVLASCKPWSTVRAKQKGRLRPELRLWTRRGARCKAPQLMDNRTKASATFQFRATPQIRSARRRRPQR